MEDEKAYDTFGHIFKCIGVLEAYESAMATYYACALSVRMQICDLLSISDEDRKELNTMFLRQWNRVYSRIHSFSFECDPLYDALRTHLEAEYSKNFVNMGHDTITSWYEATEMLKDDDRHGSNLRISSWITVLSHSNFLSTLLEWNASLFWGQV